MGAGHADGKGWTYDITSAPRTKFFGNYIDVFPVGRTRIKIRDEVFAIYPPQSRVNNILMARARPRLPRAACDAGGLLYPSATSIDAVGGIGR